MIAVRRIAKALSALTLGYLAICYLGVTLGWAIDMATQILRDLEYRRSPSGSHSLDEAIAMAHDGIR